MTTKPRRRALFRYPGLIALALLAGCEQRPDNGPVVVSAIGPSPRFDGTAPDTMPERVLIGAVAQGLVQFDGSGQIEPGLAERWIVIDGGLRYIFRLRAGQWSDGRRVTTEQVVTILNRRLRDPANPLAPYLTAIDEVVEMTPQVIEVRLTRPRPELLKLFAQPELALPRLRPPGGGGPFRIMPGRGLLLSPVADPNRAEDEAEADAGPQPERDIRLYGERAARAVARFANRDSDLVLGGTFVDWPLTIVAKIAPANVQVDPAAGLFGLTVTRRQGLLATPAGRAAVAGAIDRAAIVASFSPALTPTESLLPERLDSAATPVQPVWSALTPEERAAAVQREVAAWRAANDGKTPLLRIALPDGPGAAVLFRRLRFALTQAGIDSERVAADADDADLRLIDRVAPYDSARWYLRTACQPCSPAAEAAIDAARIAPTLAERARALAEADAALAGDVAFIPLMRPLRWSLVSLRLARFQGNPRAWHPLNHLRNDPD